MSLEKVHSLTTKTLSLSILLKPHHTRLSLPIASHLFGGEILEEKEERHYGKTGKKAITNLNIEQNESR